MGLDSSSTIADAKAQYRDNLGYDLEGSVVKCKLFIEAVRYLIEAAQLSVGRGKVWIEEMQGKLDKELDRAERWLAAHDTSGTASVYGGSVLHRSFEDFRT